jgi:hypothetical protein
MQSTLKDKINELINIIEKRCHESCQTEEVRGIHKFDLFEDCGVDAYLTYHESIGLTMFYGKVWYTDEERIERVSKVQLPNMREKILQLITETDVMTIKDLERIAFEVS